MTTACAAGAVEARGATVLVEVRDVHFQISKRGGYYEVTLLRDGAAPVKAPWELNAGDGTQFLQSLEQIEGNTCIRDDVDYVGQELWLQLTSAEVGAAFTSLRGAQDSLWAADDVSRADFVVRLDIPEELHSWPWESLYDRKVSALGFAAKPRYCIAHHPPPEASIAPYKARPGAALSMLIVAPEDTGLDVAREIEAIIEIAAARKVTPVVLKHRVTAPAIHQKLAGNHWDIVHYIGHGEVNASGRLEIAVNDDTGARVPLLAETLCDSFGAAASVRLAVFNCCRGSGGPAPRTDILSGLGPMLMRKRVPAVVTMRYEISDYLAYRFAESFYASLLRDNEAGRVDVAICEARGTLAREPRGQARSSITPILHLAPGYHRLFTFEAAAAVGAILVDRPLPAPAIIPERRELDDELKEALRQKRCIPIVGPGILRVGMERYAEGPPGPLELIRVITGAFGNYPNEADLELGRNVTPTTEWMQSVVLQWVCQHHGRTPKEWRKLAEKIGQEYQRFQCPTLLRNLAQVPFPALFYTWFDGWLQQCVLRGGPGLNEVITRISEARESMSEQHEQQLRPLVLLRGSFKDPPTMVFTEDNHDKLFADISNMRADLLEVTRRYEASVLFIGLNPREPLVRKLCQTLLVSNRTTQRMQGQTFFLCPDERTADKAYWDQFETQWVVDEIEPFLDKVIEAAS